MEKVMADRSYTFSKVKEDLQISVSFRSICNFIIDAAVAA